MAEVARTKPDIPPNAPVEDAAPDGNRARALRRTAAFSVGAAVFLVVIKLVAGIAADSVGLVASAADSVADLAVATLTMLAVRYSLRPPDRGHNYGHGKAEHLAALGESALLVLVSLALGFESIRRLLAATTPEVETAWWAFAVLGVVLVVDSSRAILSRRAAKRWNSPAMASNALHFASDFASTIAVLIGLLLVAAGEPRGDAAAALLVAGFVMVAAIRLLIRASAVLMDKAPVHALETVNSALDNVDVGVRRVRIRQAADKFFVDAVVASRPDAGLAEAHADADAVEEAIHDALPGADVIVHVEPDLGDADIRERATAAALALPGVREIHNVRVLRVGDAYELSLHAKMPRDMPLPEAHAAVEQLEQGIMAGVSEIRAVHTHIEPLTEPSTAELPADTEVRAARSAVCDVALEVTGHPAGDVEFRDGPRGRVAFVEARMDPGLSLLLAHRQAGEIESKVRRRCPELAEVVVHSEPADIDADVNVDGQPGPEAE